jgi:hypothetical protein
VATAEDDQARADLLAFAGQVPAEAWQELSLSRGETVSGAPALCAECAGSAGPVAQAGAILKHSTLER